MGAALPSGKAVVLALASAGPPKAMGEGRLHHLTQQPSVVTVEAEAWANVDATQLWVRRTGKCTMQSSYRYDIPLDLLAAGRFELKVPFSKKTVRVSLSREAQQVKGEVLDARQCTLSPIHGETTVK
jgi:hypothetical protein